MTNQASTHPGTDILVQSNGTTLVLSDVEASAGKVTANSASVELASEVVVSVRLGPDGRFSGRMDLTISYSSCTSTTTVVPTTEAPTTIEVTTTEATTTEAPTTTEQSTTSPTEPAGPEVSVEPVTTAVQETTIAPESTTTTAATPTTTAVADTDVLPVTGNGLTMPLFVLGLGLVAVGSYLALSVRRRSL